MAKLRQAQLTQLTQLTLQAELVEALLVPARRCVSYTLHSTHSRLAIMFELHPTLAKDSVILGDLPLCRVLLIKDRQYPWLVLVPRRDEVREIYQLSAADQQQFWSESAQLGEQLMHVFAGDKLNIGALGNMVPQLHVHHIVRYTIDVSWPAPIWGAQPMYNYTANALIQFKEKFFQCQLDQFIPAE